MLSVCAHCSSEIRFAKRICDLPSVSLYHSSPDANVGGRLGLTSDDLIVCHGYYYLTQKVANAGKLILMYSMSIKSDSG